jgi:hypothetical protein
MMWNDDITLENNRTRVTTEITTTHRLHPMATDEQRKELFKVIVEALDETLFTLDAIEVSVSDSQVTVRRVKNYD